MFEENGKTVTSDEYQDFVSNYPDGSLHPQNYVVRIVRNTLLKETDWWAVSDRTMTQAETDYRQALRDVPAQAGFPENVTWPTKP